MQKHLASTIFFIWAMGDFYTFNNLTFFKTYLVYLLRTYILDQQTCILVYPLFKYSKQVLIAKTSRVGHWFSTVHKYLLLRPVENVYCFSTVHKYLQQGPAELVQCICNPEYHSGRNCKATSSYKMNNTTLLIYKSEI